MATVQLFRREARDFADFDEIDRQHRDANVESIFYYAVFYPAIELVSALAAALILWVGGGWVMQDALTLGSLVAFLQYSQRFFRPISDMSEKFNILQGAMASSERIFALLDTPVEIASPAGGSAAARPRRRRAGAPGAIAFEHVTLRLRRGRAGAAGRVVRGRSPGSAWPSSAPPARARRRSSACCCGSTTCSRGGSRSTASTSASCDLARAARRCSASCCRTCTCSPARSPSNVRLGNAAINDDAVRARGRGGARGAVRRPAAAGLDDAGGRARRDAVGRAEAAAVVRPGARVRPPRADPRRGDVERRHRNRAADPRRAAAC